MLFDEFKLKQFSVQVNYPDAYSIWDAAGAVATRLSKIWPKVELENATAGEVALKNDTCKVLFGIRMSYVHVTSPKSVEEHAKSIGETFEVLANKLLVTDFDRIGARAVFVKEYKSAALGIAALRAMRLARRPSKNVFNIDIESESNIETVSYKFENESMGTTVNIAFQSLKLELKTGGEFPDADASKDLHRIVIDVDRFTKKPTSTKQFSAVEWLKGYNHLIRRDLPTIIDLPK